MYGGGGVEETPDQIQEQKNNTNLWNYIQTTYKPFIDKHIARTVENAKPGAVTKGGEPITTSHAPNAEQAKAAGQVNAEVMKTASTVPGQTNALNVTRQMNNASTVETQAGIDAMGKIRQRQLGSLQNIVDIGRGQETHTQEVQGALAGESVHKAISDKESDLRTQAALENAAGSVAGAATAAYRRNMQKPVAATGPADSYGVMQSDELKPAFNDQNWW